jgi:hypothetical protein
MEGRKEPNRWLGIVIGVQLLATVPPTLAWIWLSLIERRSAQFIVILAWNWIGLLLPWVILAMCATLSWRPLWQRCLVFAPAMTLVACASWFLNGLVSKQRGWEVSLGGLPLIVLAAIAPAFMMRVVRRWTIAPSDSQLWPRPASVSTLFAATTLCALAAAFLQAIDSLPPENEGTRIGLIVDFISFVIVPSTLIGTMLLVVMRVSFLDGTRRAWLAGAMTAITSLLVLPGLAVCLILLSARVRGVSIDSGQLLGLAFSAEVFTALALGISFASFVWLRLLGYRLLTIKDSQ